ncbi:uncharacterized protein LOC114251792 [Bombyx mandarina]|uniref:Outer kinetochore Mis12 n=2 Tax=Bombyx TaxID=7090 RepID=A0A1W7HDC7_BOMMO|nr:uncharacterized protein LOC114251792 [Bombyx mandarina]XP_037875519.1 uncharacterized protein LOC110386171 [Bombyx mori]BAX35244.1 outer kinetochore Mis12 [Bombyx mori]
MIRTLPWSGGTDEEYETQLFSFGAQRLKIATRQMIEQKITLGIKDMEAYLRESLDLNETDKSTLTKACDKLVRLYCERASPSLEVIDCEIERILKVPENVLLPGDECQVEQMTDANYAQLKDEVALLRKRVERGALMEALLTAEEEELCTVEKVCESAKKDMEALDLVFKNADNSESLKQIQNETRFLCASTSFMKENDNNIFK